MKSVRSWLLLGILFAFLVAVAQEAPWGVYAGILALAIIAMFAPDELTDNIAAVAMAIPLFGALAALGVWAVAYLSGDGSIAVIARAAFVGFSLLFILAIVTLDPHLGLGVRTRRRR